MKFSEGEEVLARHPNTVEYYKGKILSVKGDRYKILFETGLEHTVYQNDIKMERSSRSATRASTRIGRKSPSRYSPSRKSPSRRSPARSPTSANKKLPIRSTRRAKVSLPRIEIPDYKMSSEKKIVDTKQSNDDDSPTELMPLQSRLKEIGPIMRRSTRLSSAFKIEQEEKSYTSIRSNNRAVSLPIEKRNQLHEISVDGKERGHSVQGDNINPIPDDIKKIKDEAKVESNPVAMEKRKKDINLISEPQEWGGQFGVLVLMFGLPLCMILPHLACHEKKCEFTYQKNFLFPKSYINLNAFAAYFGFLICMGLISIIPIGRCIDGQESKSGRLQYRLNGFLCAIFSVITLGVCVYKSVAISDFILDNTLQLSISGWFLGTILAVLLYMKGSKASVTNLNMHALTNSTIYNFWQGKEINPRIGVLDIKIILLRASLIGMLIINAAVIIKIMENITDLNIEHLNQAALITSLLQTFYVMDILIFESSILTTFEIMYEGTGYMLCVGHLLYPFLPTITTRFMLYKKTQLNYFSAILIFWFIISYLIYRISNFQKDKFRKNPLSLSVSYLETIPTMRGKKLLVSGLWGYVRHPNYLGDIMMQWSIACMSLTNDSLPYYSAICCTLALLYKARRDNARCKIRYGNAWEQYTSRVKYMILNHIF